VASNIQLIIRQTFLMNEELPIPPSSLVAQHKFALPGAREIRSPSSLPRPSNSAGRNFDSAFAESPEIPLALRSASNDVIANRGPRLPIVSRKTLIAANFGKLFLVRQSWRAESGPRSSGAERIAHERT
jgi:hypothetical protein